MARYTPPMYHQRGPQRKVSIPSKMVVSPPAAKPVASPESVAPPKTSPVTKASPVTKDPTPQKDQIFKPKDKQTKLLKPKTKTPKVKTWSENMTQRDLYKFAKDVGLQVVTRDPKAWIIKLLRDGSFPEKVE